MRMTRQRRLRIHPRTARTCEAIAREASPLTPLWYVLTQRFYNAETQVRALFFLRNYTPPSPLQAAAEGLTPIKLTPPGQGVRISCRCWVDLRSAETHAPLLEAARRENLSVANVARAYNALLQAFREGCTRPPVELNRHYGGKAMKLAARYIRQPGGKKEVKE